MMCLLSLLSIPRSILFCLRTLPFKQAIRVPVLLGGEIIIKGKLRKGSLQINCSQVKPGMIKLGVGGGSFLLSQRSISFLQISEKGSLIFHGRCEFRRGFRIMISKNGIIEFGNHCSFNSNTMISSNSSIIFGDYFCGGWNVTVIDWDGHDIMDYEKNIAINSPKSICIGVGCWLSANSTIMKGVTLAKEVIVPYGATITKSCIQEYCIWGGSPNRVLKSGVYRKDRSKNFCL